jgi:CBS-domain-containing membrane protein
MGDKKMAGTSADRVDENSIGVKFKKLWFYYILQSFLAVVAIFILVFLLGEERVVLISAMGATSFIVFAMPQEVSAKTRNVVGGFVLLFRPAVVHKLSSGCGSVDFHYGCS